MTGVWRRILEKYGQQVTLYPEGAEEGIVCRAFLQPALERSGEGYQLLPTPLGLARQDQWIYLGGPEVPLDTLGNGYMAWGGHQFQLRAAQPVHLGDELVYWWGLLVIRDPEE